MLQTWCLMERAWSCYIGQYNGGIMVILQRVASLIEGRMVMLQRYTLIEEACSCYSGGQFTGRENGHVTRSL